MYLKELCPILHREYKDVKVDVMYLDSLEYARSSFIEDTVNRRVVVLTPKSIMIMDSTMPPKDYDEFIQMFANSEKDFADSAISDNDSKFKRAFGFLKSS